MTEICHVQIHPIPAYDNLTALADVIQRMEEVGIYLMYDMRWYALLSLANCYDRMDD